MILLRRSNQHRVTIQPSGLHPILSMSTHFFRTLQYHNPKIVLLKVLAWENHHLHHLTTFTAFTINDTYWKDSDYRIVDVKDDDNCDYCVVSILLGKGGFIHLSAKISSKIWRHGRDHTQGYTKRKKKEQYDEIHDEFIPCRNGLASVKK